MKLSNILIILTIGAILGTLTGFFPVPGGIIALMVFLSLIGYYLRIHKENKEFRKPRPVYLAGSGEY